MLFLGDFSIPLRSNPESTGNHSSKGHEGYKRQGQRAVAFPSAEEAVAVAEASTSSSAWCPQRPPKGAARSVLLAKLLEALFFFGIEN